MSLRPSAFLLASVVDLSPQVAAEERIAELTNFDPLTGLPNRSYAQRHADTLISDPQQQSLAVLVIDLDNFKYVNDTLSHSIGDRVLIDVARRLSSHNDDRFFAARLTGDEFLLIINYKDEQELIRSAGQIQTLMATPYQIDDHELIVPVSIGIALNRSDGDTFEQLIQNAETAMHRAKDDGRNTYRFFSADMHTRSKRLLALETGLHAALARNQFWLCYQPQYAASGDRIVGVEALLRWDHPDLGPLLPSEFIPLAERNGQIVGIGEWVLRTAVAQMKAWIDLGLFDVTMSVNLSAVQFRDHALPTSVQAILEEVGLPPNLLELELTETAAMVDPAAAIAMINDLSKIGIKMSIDDFGTGYSSLSYLKQFRVEKLKIDQSFVRDITHNTSDRAIVRSIISLGHNFGFRTIAEGVETEDQVNFLRSCGCDEFQGYYFSHPLKADAFFEHATAKNQLTSRHHVNSISG